MKVIKHKHKLHFLVTTMLVSGTLLYFIPPHFGNSYAVDCSTATTNCTKEDNAASANTQFAVQVNEVLEMTVTTPANDNNDATDWAKDDVEKFLRNEVQVAVKTNNTKGFTTGMTAKDTTDLIHNTKGTAIHTLSGAIVRSNDEADSTIFENFPKNAWGFSLDDTITAGTYNPIVASTAVPTTILDSKTNGSGTKPVYFGAKAGANVDSGTYTGTVKFITVAGTGGTALTPQNPAPSNPSSTETPAAPAANGSVSQVESSSYTYTTGTRTYTTSSASSARQIAMGGDTTTDANGSDIAVTTDSDDTTKDSDTKDTYLAPLGVVDRTTASSGSASPVTHILMTVASVAAVTGAGFFAVAKFHDIHGE